MWRKAFLLTIALLFFVMVVQRVRLAANSPVGMPSQLTADEETRLHLTAGGRYSTVDIEANGRMPPSQRYRGFRAKHDYQPVSGDLLCPITRTKANADCTWTIDGQVYQFCCPPCIDEFVRLAKEQPNQILPAAAYVQ